MSDRTWDEFCEKVVTDHARGDGVKTFGVFMETNCAPMGLYPPDPARFPTAEIYAMWKHHMANDDEVNNARGKTLVLLGQKHMCQKSYQYDDKVCREVIYSNMAAEKGLACMLFGPSYMLFATFKGGKGKVDPETAFTVMDEMKYLSERTGQRIGN